MQEDDGDTQLGSDSESEPEEDVIDSKMVFRLGISENSQQRWQELNEMQKRKHCQNRINNVETKKWNSDVDKVNDMLREQGRIPIVEIYSPPRVDSIARMWNLLPGMSVDLTTLDPDDGKPWDFNSPEKRDKIEAIVESGKIMLLIGSPMCSAFSQIQSLNYSRMAPERREQIISDGRRHLVTSG